MTDDYVGRHRPPTRAERRALARRTRAPKTLGPGYALPTAAAATLVLSAAGATAAQTAFGASTATAAQAAIASPASVAQDSGVADAAREQMATQVADSAGLAERRQASSVSVAKDQGRAQQAQRAARAERREAAAEKKREEAAERREAAASRAAERSSTTSSGSSSSAASAAGPQDWVQPIDNPTFTSPFGPRWGRLHAGQDYAAPTGTPLKSMSSGTVVQAGEMSGYGNTVDIEYWDGTVSRYGHMDSIDVTVGQEVGPGDVVGRSGNTGRSTGPHLHVEIHPDGGEPIDPGPWLEERGLGLL